MPAYPRKHLVRRDVVAVYHCWTRCVRRAFLCGRDRYTGRDYEHRRDWIWQVEEQLAGLFGIEVEFRAEMRNHLHLVLRVRPDVVRRWSNEQVITRWLKIARLKRASPLEGWEPPEARLQEMLKDRKLVKRLRRRLSNISWFMGALCENIARRANREDDCRGHFFQSRFFCKPLESEPVILACGIYVDLNQIRAGEALTPETSRHTSAYDRIQATLQRARTEGQVSPSELPDRWLSPLQLQEGPQGEAAALSSVTGCRASDKGVLPLTLARYLELLEWTGRQWRSDKPGAIPAELEQLFARLGFTQDEWLVAMEAYDLKFGTLEPKEESLESDGGS
jgi:hypothetical protein